MVMGIWDMPPEAILYIVFWLKKKRRKRQSGTTWLIFTSGLGKLGFALLFRLGQASLDSCFRFSALKCVKTVLLRLVKAQVCVRKDSNICISVGSPIFQQAPKVAVRWNCAVGEAGRGRFCLCLVGLGLPGIEINKVPAVLSLVLSWNSDSWPSLLPFLNPFPLSFLSSLLFLMFWNKVSRNLGYSLAFCNTRDDLELLTPLFPLPSARITGVYLVSNLTFSLAIQLRWNSHTNDVLFLFYFFDFCDNGGGLFQSTLKVSVHCDCTSYGRYTIRVANLWASRECPVSISHTIGIIDWCFGYCIWLYMGSGDLNSVSHSCMASPLPTEPFP